MVQSPSRTNPFPGLRPFELDEEHLFFGREGQADELLTRLNRTRFLAVVGTSGSGKSSLVRAGLLPSLYSGFLQDASSGWRMAILRPGSAPMANLAAALNAPEVFGVDPASDDAVIRVALTESTLRRGPLGVVEVAQQARMEAHENLLLVIDQFEELFRFKAQAQNHDRKLVAEDEAAAFVKLLLGAVNQRSVPIFVVLTMRSDFLGDCAQFRDLPETLNDSQYLIPRLTREQLKTAIEGPVAVGGATITPRLVNRLLNDTGDNPDQLPILQHALMRTWDYWEDQHQPQTPIDLDHYEAIGGMAKALSRHANQIYADLPDDQSRQLAKTLFKCLTDQGAADRAIRRPTLLGEICVVADASESAVIAVIDQFRAPRRSFLMPPPQVPLSASTMIDISHESLMRNWRRLKKWVDEEAQSAQIYKRLADTAELHGKGEAGYWRDPELTIGLTWQKEQKPNPVWAERYAPNFGQAITFLEESARTRNEEIAAQEKAQRFKVNTYRLFSAVVGGLFLAASSIAVAAFKLKNDADHQKQEANRQTGIAQVERNRAEKEAKDALTQRSEAIRQKSSALNQQDKAEKARVIADRAKKDADSAKEQALTQELKAKDAERAEAIQRQLAEEALTEAERQAEIADENEIAATNAAKDANRERLNAKLSEAKTLISSGHVFKALLSAMQLGKELNDQPEVTSATLLRVASTLQKAIYFEGFVEINSASGHSQWVESVSFSPDGNYLISSSADQTIKIWDRSGNELKTLSGYTSSVQSIGVSPAGDLMASGSADGTMKLWDIRNATNPLGLRELNHFVSINDLEFSPAPENSPDHGDITEKQGKPSELSQLLAYATAQGNIIIWKVEDLSVPSIEIPFREGELEKGTDLRDLLEIRKDEEEAIYYQVVPVLGQAGQLLNVELKSEDFNTFLYILSPKNEIVADNDDIGYYIDSYNSNSALSTPLPVSGEYKIIVTSASPITTGTYSLRGFIDSPFAIFQNDSKEPVNDIHFSPSQNLLASASADGKIRIWDVRNKSLIKTLEGHPSFANSVRFDPLGKSLASGDAEGNLLLWQLPELLSSSSEDNSFPENEFIFDKLPVKISSSDNVLEERKTFYKEFSFQGQVGESIFARLNVFNKNFGEIGFDTYLILKDELGQIIAENDDSFGTFDSALSVVLPKTGTYRLIATTYAEGEEGEAHLTAMRTSISALIKAHDGPINSVSFNHTGDTIATSSADATIKLWDYFGRLKQTLPGHMSAVNEVDFSQDDKTLVSAGDSTVRLWKLNENHYPRIDNSIGAYDVDIGNNIIAIREFDGRVSAWNIKGKEIVDFFGDDDFHGSSNVAFSPDGRFLAFDDQDSSGDQDSSRVILWDVMRKNPVYWDGHEGLVTFITFSPDGLLVASGDSSGKVLIRDLRAPRKIARAISI
jgi:WD40 repeat protein/energy-coupling factor transporter ATP-binding protein EcfA2